jgi:hypothetical protein
MIRPLAAAAALAAFALAGAASAQTWGQPVYLNAYGHPVGGTPLSEVETRSYVATGRWADGYSDRPRIHVPAPGYEHPYPARHDRSHPRRGRHDTPARRGYRDTWGYHDDRPPSAGRWSDQRRAWRQARDCGCGDVYLYDR